MSDQYPPPNPPPLVRLVEIEGKGRALVASQPLKAGQVVLRDSPILLYSAFPMVGKHQPQPQGNTYCANCFRIAPRPCPCPWCSTSLFCNHDCRSIALSSSHTPWVCQALKRLQDASSPLSHHQLELQVQAVFLVAAYNLAVISPCDFKTLLSLQGVPAPNSFDAAASFLHSLLSSICPPNHSEFGFSVELTTALLAKDKSNAFGLMEPFAPDKERSVRAYGIYPRASFFNHDCLPNACRFDYVDSYAPSLTNTDILVRALHDIPEGREICLSYFPVNLKYSDRQCRLKEDYGFICHCDRCKVETNWSDQDEDDEDLSDDDSLNNEREASMDVVPQETMETLCDPGKCGDGVVKEDDDFPHAYFFLRYMCNKDNCWGTLAPLPPSDAIPSTVMECNVCGDISPVHELMDVNAPDE